MTHDPLDGFCNRCLDTRPGLLDVATGVWRCDCGWIKDLTEMGWT